MDKLIEQMVKKYSSETVEERKNSFKEVIQEIVLCGLSRAGFFDSAVFYGGTALRIFYGLDRFSEDLDFSLMQPDPDFKLSRFLPILEKEVRAFGLDFKTEEKEKTFDSNIRSAFLKGNTKEHLLMFYSNSDIQGRISQDELIKIKIEVDVNPPAYATFERKYRLLPYPYEVGLYDQSSLFAGKIHAVICRGWKNRVKGRDLYDYVFYLSHGVPVNLKHLNERLIQSGFIPSDKQLSIQELRQVLFSRFAEIDYEKAKSDVEPFIKNNRSIALWDKEFFTSITEQLTCI
ncbi:MAG: nucleotidyl transferase AbiEii/AbiGii toxin family protein [Clostridia bacterium]